MSNNSQSNYTFYYYAIAETSIDKSTYLWLIFYIINLIKMVIILQIGEKPIDTLFFSRVKKSTSSLVLGSEMLLQWLWHTANKHHRNVICYLIWWQILRLKWLIDYHQCFRFIFCQLTECFKFRAGELDWFIQYYKRCCLFLCVHPCGFNISAPHVACGVFVWRHAVWKHSNKHMYGSKANTQWEIWISVDGHVSAASGCAPVEERLNNPSVNNTDTPLQHTTNTLSGFNTNTDTEIYDKTNVIEVEAAQKHKLCFH